MASAGRIIREVVCWNRSVFSKVSLVVSLEILNKSNQTNRRTTDALGQIWNISTEKKKYIYWRRLSPSSSRNVRLFTSNNSFQSFPYPNHQTKISWKIIVLVQKVGKISAQPHTSLCMHILVNYAFYPLSLNTIDNSLANWIHTSLIITYCTNKRGFFFTAFLSALFFPLSLSPFSPLSLPHFSGRHISFKAPLSLLFLFF